MRCVDLKKTPALAGLPANGFPAGRDRRAHADGIGGLLQIRQQAHRMSPLLPLVTCRDRCVEAFGDAQDAKVG